MAGDRKEEHDQVRGEAEAFIAPIVPMLDAWKAWLEPQGIILGHQLLVGPFPSNAPENPVKAALMVSVKGKGVRNGGSVYSLEGYMPDQLDWMAAEIEHKIEEHLDDPEFGSLWDGIADMSFRRLRYDRENDHEHCSCCLETICAEFLKTGERSEGVSIAYVGEKDDDPPYEVWLCPRCFDYWSPRRNLTVNTA